MRFHDPWILGFIVLAIPLIMFAERRRLHSSFSFPSGKLIEPFRYTVKMRLARAVVFLRALAFALAIVALARPQVVVEEFKTSTEGVDIVLALDTSTSMLAEDFKGDGKRLNRFDVTREVVKDFIERRKDDRMAIVAFAARPYTVCPLTFDHQWLSENLDRVTVGMIEDATAVGSAIAASLSRLKETHAKSKIVILVTDGVNNAGKITPLTAAESAKALAIKIYAVGVGSKGPVPYPVKDQFGRVFYQNISIDLDEKTLQEIADLTNGKYYRATDTETLRKIYGEIDRLEKTTIEHTGYREYKELFGYFLIGALAFLLFEIILLNTVFIRIP